MLHRALAPADDSVIGYVRKRRIQIAHSRRSGLPPSGWVSDIAAEWNVPDPGHLFRQCKEPLGTVPAAARAVVRRVGVTLSPAQWLRRPNGNGRRRWPPK